MEEQAKDPEREELLKILEIDDRGFYEKTAQTLAEDGSGTQYFLVEEIEHPHRRWSREVDYVIRSSTGRHWTYTLDIPLTENSGETAHADDWDLEEVWPVEKTVKETTWASKPPKVTQPLHEILSDYFDEADESQGELTEKLLAIVDLAGEKLDGYRAVIAHLEADAEGLKKREQALAKRRKARENRAESLRKRVFDALTEMNVKKVQTAEGTIYKRKTERIEVPEGWADKAVGPYPELVRTVHSPDKDALKELLKSRVAFWKSNGLKDAEASAKARTELPPGVVVVEGESLAGI